MIAIAIIFVWMRDDDEPAKTPSSSSVEVRPEAASGPENAPERPARVMPRQGPTPRSGAPVAPPATRTPGSDAPSAAAPPPEPASAPFNNDPEINRRVENAKQLFEDTDFEAAAEVAQKSLELYPESFWLRSLAVKSLCALGEIQRAKDLIAEEPRLSQRKRLRVHCSIQADQWN